MRKIGLIGGTGSLAVTGNEARGGRPITTPYGDTSSPMLSWRTQKSVICCIIRHGLDGSIPPHLVNYRANVWALSEQSPDLVVGLNAVGGIASTAPPAMLLFPNQLVDYTWGRAHTFADGSGRSLQHVDFTAPFSEEARAVLIDAARAAGLAHHAGGTYGVTQGPRLETAAEIDRLERDGCDLVGMTAMPEAALARELGLEYAICAVVVNRAAGRGPEQGRIHDEMRRFLDTGMARARQLLAAL
ncbi:MAG: S-methyl-5'-thioinosine phosphorylase [Gammaproteobacteria bacterium]